MPANGNRRFLLVSAALASLALSLVQPMPAQQYGTLTDATLNGIPDQAVRLDLYLFRADPELLQERSSQTTPPLKSRIVFMMRPTDTIPAGTTWTVHINEAIHLDVPTVWSSAGSEPGSGLRASTFNFSNGKVMDLSPNYMANMRCLCVRGPS